MLLQLSAEGSAWKPPAIIVKKLKLSELMYLVPEKEFLAVVHALHSWRLYVQGEQQEVVKDHRSALGWFIHDGLMRGRLAKWILKIRKNQFKVVHRHSDTVVVRNALIRDGFLPLTCPHYTEVLKVRHDAPALPTEEGLKRGVASEEERLADAEGNNANGWTWNGAGLLCYRKIAGSRLLVPKELRKKVLNYYHGNLLRGHYGETRMIDKGSSRFWWPKFQEDFRARVVRCIVYAIEQPNRSRRQGRFRCYQASRWGEVFGVNFLIIILASSNGCMKFLVMADALTRLL